MNTEQLFTDDVVIEEFQEHIKIPEISKKENNICKTVLSNIILINPKPNDIISKNLKSKLEDSQITNSALDFIDIKFSSCLNNIEKTCLVDTMSLGSESIEETFSGSSLHRFDSPNNSDSFDDETFLEEIQKQPSKCDPISNNNIFVSEMVKDTFLQELKTAIKIKWIDRAIYIKKTIQQRSQDLWDRYFKSLTVEEQLAISAVQNSKSSEISNVTDFLDTIKLLPETIYHGSEEEAFETSEHIEYPIESYTEVSVVSKCVEIDENEQTIITEPTIKDPVLTKTVQKQYHIHNSTLKRTIKQRLIRSKSESWPSRYENLLMKNKNHFEAVNIQQGRTIESLQNQNKSFIYEINNRERILEKMQQKNNEISFQLNQRISELRMAYGSVQQLKLELLESKKHVHQYESENINLHKINESLVLFKTNAEDFILNEQKNNEILSKQIDNYHSIESEYEWLYKAFMDYKNLGQDYDNLQLNYFESQMKLNDFTKTIDSLQNQIIYLEQEKCNNRINIDETKKINRCENRENLCQCQQQDDCHHCSHSRSRSSRSKHKSRKEEKKIKKQTQYSDDSESDRKPVYENVITMPVDNTYHKQESYENPEPDIKELERKYDSLQIKKRTLESELSHVPISGTSSIRQSHAASRGEKEQIENELDAVDHEISSIRRTLKQFNVMGDRSAHYNKS